MPISVATTRVALRTTAGTQDITIPGFGTPKAALFLLNQATSDGVATDTDSVVIGMTDGAQQWTCSATDGHGVSTSLGYRAQDATGVLYKFTASRALDLFAAFDSWVTDGVRIDVTSTLGTPYLLTVVLFGGSHLTAYVGNLASSATVGGTAVTTAPGFGFDDLLGVSTGILGQTDTGHYSLSLGVCHHDSGVLTERGLGWFRRDTVNLSECIARLDTTRFLYNPLGPSGTRVLEVTERSSTGFTVTTRGSAVSCTFGYLALNYGGAAQSSVVTVTTPTSTGAQIYTGPGFLPQAVLLAQSLLTSVDTETTTSSAGTTALSVLTSPAQYCLAQSSADGVATTNTQSLHDNVAQVAPYDYGSPAFAATLTSFDALGWTLNYSTVSSTIRYGFAWAISQDAPPVHDAVSESHTGTTGSTGETSFTWNHPAVGIPRGVLVLTFTNANADDATGVTYGGVALTAVPNGRAVDTLGEAGDCKAWFLGSGVPSTTPAAVVVSRNNTANVMYAVCLTVTAASDTEIKGTPVLVQGDGTLDEQSVDAGSGVQAIRYAGVNSGLQTFIDNPTTPGTSLSRGANSTATADIDFGQRVAFVVRETLSGGGSRPVGFRTTSSDDRAAVHVAIGNAVLGETRALTAAFLSETTTPASAVVLGETRALTATFLSDTSTPPSAATLAHALTATLLSATSTPTSPAVQAHALTAAFLSDTSTPPSAATLATLRSLTAALLSATSTPTSPAVQAHALTAALSPATTTPASAATLAHALTTTLLSATSTPTSPAVQAHALTAGLVSDTNTPPSAVTLATLRSLTATLLSATTTLDSPVTQAKALAAGLLSTTSTPASGATQTRALTAALSPATATPASPVLQARALVGGLLSDTTTPPFAISLAQLIILTAHLTNTTTTPNSVSLQARGLTAALNPATATPDSAVLQARALTGGLLSQTSTPSAAISLAGQIAWTALLAGTTTTPASPSPQTRAITASVLTSTSTPASAATLFRTMSATLPATTTTPDSPIALAGLRQLVATLGASTTTPASAPTSQRALLSGLLGATLTPDSPASVLRPLLATLPSATATPTSALTLARGGTAHPLGTTSTPSAPALTITRSLTAAMSVATSTPGVTITVTGQVVLASSLLGQTSTPLAPLTTRRPLLALLPGTSGTPDALSTMAGIRALTATLVSATTTPALGAVVQRALTMAPQATTSTGAAPSVLQRLLTGALANHSTTPAVPAVSTLRLLAAALPAATTTPLGLAGVRQALTAVLPGTTLTPAGLSTLARALTAAPLLASQTPPLLPVESVRTLLAAIGTLTMTPLAPIFISGQVLLVAHLVPTTSTPEALAIQGRALVAALTLGSTTLLADLDPGSWAEVLRPLAPILGGVVTQTISLRGATVAPTLSPRGATVTLSITSPAATAQGTIAPVLRPAEKAHV